jgi:cytochrome c biogenesis protein CcmG/thiol:disulfide interchange protein DsbE
LPRNRSSTARRAAQRLAAPTPFLVVAVAVVVALAACVAGCGRSTPPADAPAPAAPARPLGAEPLLERSPEQFEADLAALRGRVVVVNFWASWCGPCRKELPLLRQAAEDYERAAVTVVGVDVGDRRADALAFLARSRATFPTVFDPKGFQGGIASRWSVTGLPQTWFVGADGGRAGRFAGAIDAQELRHRIDDLLQRAGEAG